MIKFGAVVGNPPYQKNIENTSDEQIYNHFMDLAYCISDIAVLITPARFLYNAGKTPKNWNNKMLNDEHLKIVYHEINSDAIFPGTNVNGGIVITYHDANKKFSPIKFFGVDNTVVNIRNKVRNFKGFDSIKSIVYLQNKFNLQKIKADFPNILSKIGSKGREKRILSSAFQTLPELFSDSQKAGTYKILGNDSSKNRVIKYIKKEYLDNYGNIDKYKIILSATDGASGTIGNPIPARIIGKQSIAVPGDGYNQTFISLGDFNNEIENNNLSKYLKCKFTRFMIGTLKATNGLKQDIWDNVPIQNFSNNSDIVWSNSVQNIDQQLYKKYDLKIDEIEFIERMIKSID